MKAIVCFGDGNAAHPLSWLLKPDFRHCFVCVEENGLWLMVDGQEGRPVVRYLTESSFDLATFYRSQGMKVVETRQREEALWWPMALRNCVGIVKTMLCLRSWAVTPYQLFRHLTRK